MNWGSACPLNLEVMSTWVLRSKNDHSVGGPGGYQLEVFHMMICAVVVSPLLRQDGHWPSVAPEAKIMKLRI